MSAPGNKRRRDDGGRNDWRTPPELFRLLDMEFRFTLDAAADDENHLCEQYLTEAEDALSADVADHVVWCNPPYGDLAPWVTPDASRCCREGDPGSAGAATNARPVGPASRRRHGADSAGDGGAALLHTAQHRRFGNPLRLSARHQHRHLPELPPVSRVAGRRQGGTQ